MAGEVTHGAIHLLRFAAPDKPRPVVVLTRASALKFLTRVTVAPITTTIRSIPSEVELGVDDGMKEPCAINLDNVVTVPRDRLGRRVAQLGPAKRDAICRALAFALGCDGRASTE